MLVFRMIKNSISLTRTSDHIFGKESKRKVAYCLLQNGSKAEAPLRRSLSEPAMARRRCGVDFGAEAAAAATRASYRRITGHPAIDLPHLAVLAV